MTSDPRHQRLQRHPHRPDRSPHPDHPRPDGGPPARGERSRRWPLVVPLLLLAWPPLYNRTDPVVLGVPFFYAYQVTVIMVAAACTWLVYRRDRARAGGADAG